MRLLSLYTIPFSAIKSPINPIKSHFYAASVLLKNHSSNNNKNNGNDNNNKRQNRPKNPRAHLVTKLYWKKNFSMKMFFMLKSFILGWFFLGLSSGF